MSFRISTCLILVVLALSMGCSRHFAGVYRQGVASNQLAIQRLSLGMSESDVRTAMGEGIIVEYGRIHLIDPWRSESYALEDGTGVLLLYYISAPSERYGRPDDSQLTPVAIEDGRVVGWGWSYLNQNNDRYRVGSPPAQR